MDYNRVIAQGLAVVGLVRAALMAGGLSDARETLAAYTAELERWGRDTAPGKNMSPVLGCLDIRSRSTQGMHAKLDAAEQRLLSFRQ